MFKLNEAKYKNALLYLASKTGKGTIRGKKRLCKLLYFLDFDFFEKFERPFTGDVYKKLPMGPFPIYLDAIVDEMKKEDSLGVGSYKTGRGYNPTFIYKAKREPDVSVFSREEKKMLNRIAEVYGDKTGTELEALTHKEAPFLAVEDNEVIPYELSFYRGTNFA